MTFSFTSGPSFLLTFIALLCYAVYVKAPFSEVWIALGTVYGLHIGKRLAQRIKAAPRNAADCDDPASNGASSNSQEAK